MFEKLLRPKILKLKAYESARSLNLTADHFLDANENFDGPYNRYPQPRPESILNALSDYYETSKESIFLGRGSDEAIDTLMRCFCEPGSSSILITPPTYGMYEVSAEIQGAFVKKVPLDLDFDLNVNPVLQSIDPSTKMIFLCSPNNPTGNVLTRDRVLSLLDRIKQDVLVVIDEAYIEFSQEESFVKELKNFENLIVLRTVSKAFGLAGLRLGVAISNPELIAVMNKVRAPYPIAQPVVEAFEKFWAEFNPESFQTSINEYMKLKNLFVDKLKQKQEVLRVYPSQTNFVLVEFKDATQVFERLKSKGLLVRDQQSKIKNALRITVGSAEQNQLILKELV
ncbi:MAG: histidinol-phosphate transaminase [Bdellovibrionales bacterium]|nr:histidinol-phosphate transaminase [Bdellovibrionales bacterium]